MASGLSIDLAGLELANPTMLASGIMGLSAESLGNIVQGGAGAIVTKSVGLKPKEGYPNPTVVQADCGLLNAIGLPSPGVDEFSIEIRKAKALGVPIVVSIYGFSADEYAEAAGEVVDSGADAVELNVSCPHVEKTGLEIGQSPESLANVVAEVKSAIVKPVLVKLSPNVADIAAIAEVAVEAGADALTAINTVKAMAIDTRMMMPILGNKIGGLSGPAIKPIAVRCIYEISKRVETPIIGCGGITDWKDTVEFLLAGASAVQIGTAIAEMGSNVFKSVTDGLGAYLRRNGFKSVKEIVGLAHKGPTDYNSQSKVASSQA